MAATAIPMTRLGGRGMNYLRPLASSHMCAMSGSDESVCVQHSIIVPTMR